MQKKGNKSPVEVTQPDLKTFIWKLLQLLCLRLLLLRELLLRWQQLLESAQRLPQVLAVEEGRGKNKLLERVPLPLSRDIRDEQEVCDIREACDIPAWGDGEPECDEQPDHDGQRG
jgi:hypothetical protein